MWLNLHCRTLNRSRKTTAVLLFRSLRTPIEDYIVVPGHGTSGGGRAILNDDYTTNQHSKDRLPCDHVISLISSQSVKYSRQENAMEDLDPRVQYLNERSREPAMSTQALTDA